jgi:hypothetical protein
LYQVPTAYTFSVQNAPMLFARIPPRVLKLV